MIEEGAKMTMEEKDNAIKIVNQIVDTAKTVNYIKLIKSATSKGCNYSWEIKVLMGDNIPTDKDIETLEKLNNEMINKFDSLNIQ